MLQWSVVVVVQAEVDHPVLFYEQLLISSLQSAS